MTGTGSAISLGDLADAHQALAEKLDAQQSALNYRGTQAAELGRKSANLSAQASALRTLVVAAAIANRADAVAALKKATDDAKSATDTLKDAAEAIEVAGLLLSVGAAVASGNPTAIIAAGLQLADYVGDQAPG